MAENQERELVCAVSDVEKHNPGLKELAETYHIALICGLVGAEDVVRLADKVIDEIEDPEHEWIEVAMGGSVSLAELASRLHRVPGETTQEAPYWNVLSALSVFLRNNPYEVLGVAQKISQATYAAGMEEQEAIWAESAYSLMIEDRMGLVSGVEKMIHEIIDRFPEREGILDAITVPHIPNPPHPNPSFSFRQWFCRLIKRAK